MKQPTNTLTLDAYKRLLARQEEQEKKRKARKKPGHEESTIQQSFVTWFRAAFPEHALMLFAVPNGGGRSRVESAIMKGEGVTAGVSDLIFLEAHGGYGALCIEFKTTRKESKQSKSQKIWQAAAEKAGNKYVIVRTLDEAICAAISYINMPINTMQARISVTELDFELCGLIPNPTGKSISKY